MSAPPPPLPRRGIPLHERSTTSGIGAPPPAPPPRAAHVWIREGEHTWPGLLLEQARGPAGWVCLVVVRRVDPDTEAVTATTGWIAAELIHPA